MAETSDPAFATLASVEVLRDLVRNRHELTLSHLRGGFLGGPPREVRARLTPRKTIWVHAASAGETAAAMPLVHRLEALGHGPILMTATTYQGLAIARRRQACACYRPIDLPGRVQHALDAIEPRLLLLVESELWPNLLMGASRRSIPIAVVNADMFTWKDSRFSDYLLPVFRKMLQTLSAVGTRTEGDRDRFLEYGVSPERVEVMGELKAEATPARVTCEDAALLRAELGVSPDRPLLVIGSTHEGEEQQLLSLLQRVRRTAPERSRARELRAIIAPLDITRAAAVVQLARGAGFSADTPGAKSETDIVVLDRIGLLARCYSLGDVAFVGGSLLPSLNGHSVWEPLAQGKPIIYGPSMPRQTLHEDLERDGIAVRGTIDVLAPAVLAWILDETRRREIDARCARIMAASVGATERATRLVVRLLERDGVAPRR